MGNKLSIFEDWKSPVASAGAGKIRPRVVRMPYLVFLCVFALVTYRKGMGVGDTEIE